MSGRKNEDRKPDERTAKWIRQIRLLGFGVLLASAIGLVVSVGMVLTLYNRGMDMGFLDIVRPPVFLFLCYVGYRVVYIRFYS